MVSAPRSPWRTLLIISQYTTDLDSTNRLQSITQERDLDEFLNTATLAGTNFTAGAHPRPLFCYLAEMTGPL